MDQFTGLYEGSSVQKDGEIYFVTQILKLYEQEYKGTAARYGGDEFILILHSLNEKNIREIVEKLCASLNTTINTKDPSFRVHRSLGVSFFPSQETHLEGLICKADLALYPLNMKEKIVVNFMAINNYVPFA